MHNVHTLLFCSVCSFQHTHTHARAHAHAGGSGFLGQHLVSQLLASGKYDVRVFDVRDPGTCSVPVTVGDLRKREQVRATMRMLLSIATYFSVCIQQQLQKPLKQSAVKVSLGSAPLHHTCAPLHHTCAPLYHTCAPLYYTCAAHGVGMLAEEDRCPCVPMIILTLDSPEWTP